MPLELYFRRGRAKLLVGLGRGKKHHDRREDVKKRMTERDVRPRPRQPEPRMIGAPGSRSLAGRARPVRGHDRVRARRDTGWPSPSAPTVADAPGARPAAAALGGTFKQEDAWLDVFVARQQTSRFLLAAPLFRFNDRSQPLAVWRHRAARLALPPAAARDRGPAAAPRGALPLRCRGGR